MDVWNVESYKNVPNVTLKQTNNKQTNNYKKKKKTINRWRTRSIKGITNMKILGHAKCNNNKKIFTEENNASFKFSNQV